ncbi:DUF7341 domain-containing protein [Subtercola vilae]|uniref:DUF7341 domain-containing protein n=1 Tax=Subtercola vilae TaxID=2056433 RepID=A0A4T2BRZ6_9MICO|nr:hypothetical protein [Subtercola vilae]TIH33692.1 hypothetical protein D4765_14515 [Subtercola vilae]
MTDLLDAVQNLTRPTRSKVLQTNTAGIQCLSDVEQLPLLVQLEAAIKSSMGGASTSGASLAFEGSMLNTAALFEAVKIGSQIKSWCRDQKLLPTKNMGTDLDAWYVATLRTEHATEWETWHVKTLSSWAARIRNMLAPPREREHPEACPVCLSGDWWSPRDGLRYLHPLVTYYRLDDEEMLVDNARSLCRACAATWSPRELAFELEAKGRNTEAIM